MDEEDFSEIIYHPIATEIIEGICIETYQIDVPSDLFKDVTERADYAIYAAREGCAAWIVPANWASSSDDGETVTVHRFYRVQENKNG